MEPLNRFCPQLESLDDRLPPSSINSAHTDAPNSTTDTTTAAQVQTTEDVIFKFPGGKHWHRVLI